VSTEDNKRLVLEYYRRVVAEARFSDIPLYIAPAYLDHNSPVDGLRGPELVADHLRAMRQTFPDFTLRTHEAIAEGSWVAVRVTAEGTHRGEWVGIKPTGRRVLLRGINFDRVHQGLIVEHYGEADTVGMLLQMGVDAFKGRTECDA
jgi:predicted ester cyclase